LASVTFGATEWRRWRRRSQAEPPSKRRRRKPPRPRPPTHQHWRPQSPQCRPEADRVVAGVAGVAATAEGVEPATAEEVVIPQRDHTVEPRNQWFLSTLTTFHRRRPRRQCIDADKKRQWKGNHRREARCTCDCLRRRTHCSHHCPETIECYSRFHPLMTNTNDPKHRWQVESQTPFW
jgi:hypothetical protein